MRLQAQQTVHALQSEILNEVAGDPALSAALNNVSYATGTGANNTGFEALPAGADDHATLAAAKALATSSPARDNPKHNLLPPVSALREVAVTVALAVALQAHKEGLVTGVPTDQIEQRIRAKVWIPRYVPYRRA